MKGVVDDILQEIDSEISTIDVFGRNAIADSLHMINYIEIALEKIRERIQNYVFSDIKDEITFFKEMKPEILGRLLYFHKVYSIECKFPNGSDEAARKYLNDQLHSLEFFFNRNLDFYQYYRSKSTLYDEYYFTRGRTDVRLYSDSSRFDRDPNFSSGFDYKVAKILANEMLRIFLNKRLQNIGKEKQLEESRTKYLKSPISFTGKKIVLIEIGYALSSAGYINNGNIEIKEVMDYLGAVFNIDLGEYYAAYVGMKGRQDRTKHLNKLSQLLMERMDEDDAK